MNFIKRLLSSSRRAASIVDLRDPPSPESEHQEGSPQTANTWEGESESVVSENRLPQKTPASILQTKGENESGEHALIPPYAAALDLRDYKYPHLDLLETYSNEKVIADPAELEANKSRIITTLKNYGITIQKITASVGPSVTLYEIVPAAGVRISRIKNLEDDIALNLAALGIRIIAPIPGRGTIGIEVPNHKKNIVSMKALLASEKFTHSNFNLPIAIGKKIDNENFIVDLTTMPHLLMAGATGKGKSVGVNAILVSLLYKKHPSQLKFVLIDPKKVELSVYRHIEKHFLAKLHGEEDAILTDTHKVINTLNALCMEMDNRYDLLKEAGARNIKEYNDKFVKHRINTQKSHHFLPFIVLVVDSYDQLKAAHEVRMPEEIQAPIGRLVDLGANAGIHVVLSTQECGTRILAESIRKKMPIHLAFRIYSKHDADPIVAGAEKLCTAGEMLISHGGETTRVQGAFVDTQDVARVVKFISEQGGYDEAFLLPEFAEEHGTEIPGFDFAERDPLFEEAALLIVQNQIGSRSLLQRRMRLGYHRAGRLMDQLEAAGVVGPDQGSKARAVLIRTEEKLLEHLQTLGDS